MGNNASTAGQELRRLRLTNGLSRRQLAEQTGVSASAIRTAEYGKALTRPALMRLATVLGGQVWDAVPAWPPIDDGDVPVLAARRAAGVSRREAAEAIGVTPGVLARAERGLRVHPSNALMIADAYGLDVIALFPAEVAAAQDDDREPAVA